MRERSQKATEDSQVPRNFNFILISLVKNRHWKVKLQQGSIREPCGATRAVVVSGRWSNRELSNEALSNRASLCVLFEQ